jgi:hypothetical protein
VSILGVHADRLREIVAGYRSRSAHDSADLVTEAAAQAETAAEVIARILDP